VELDPERLNWYIDWLMRKFPAHLDTFEEAIKFDIAKKMLETSLKKYIPKEGLRIQFKQYMKDSLCEDK
jgi:hypothetical protein